MKEIENELEKVINQFPGLTPGHYQTALQNVLNVSTQNLVADAQIEKVREQAEAFGFKIWPGDYLAEVDAAGLLGITPGALRKQVAEGRNWIEFIQRGNRRFYPIAQIAVFF